LASATEGSPVISVTPGFNPAIMHKHDDPITQRVIE
jgi:hypothetical protein